MNNYLMSIMDWFYLCIYIKIKNYCIIKIYNIYNNICFFAIKYIYKKKIGIILLVVLKFMILNNSKNNNNNSNSNN
jgi:hypothetical protein